VLLNTASQSIGAQMVTAADGTAFTGSVTVAVTIDSGTQATGTVGSGACAHEGNGYHSYRPSQAETNGAHIAFTFTGTGAIPATVQVFTRAGDAFTRLGAPAGASVSADVAAVKVDTAAILVDTGTTLDARIPAALVSGRMDASVGAMAANVLTATAINADAITAAKLAADVTTELQSGLATAAALATVDGIVDDILLDTAEIGAAGAGLTAVPWVAPTADGAHPTLGIIDQGTAQSASATGIVLRSAAAFADNTLIGAVVFAFGSTQGYWQSRVITDNALTGDSVTVDTWTVTPSGTITYKIFGSPPGSTTIPVPANVVQVIGDPVQTSGATDTNWGGAP
jgi:hypothetical protein